MKKLFAVVLVLLFIIIAGEGAYLCYLVYENGYTSTSVYESKLLIVSEESSYADDEDLSDATQIRNAIRDGGQIFIKLDNDWLGENFPSEYKSYGAANEENMMWTRGAYLNYIASRGWILSEVSGNTYYFVQADMMIRPSLHESNFY